MIPRAVHARQRGCIEWKPRAETLALIERVRAIRAEYADYLPLSLRQIFYRLVGAHGCKKTERAYDPLGETLNRRVGRDRLAPLDTKSHAGYECLPVTAWQLTTPPGRSFCSHPTRPVIPGGTRTTSPYGENRRLFLQENTGVQPLGASISEGRGGARHVPRAFD